jgi:aryl-alcohol dehydrogenase-like predicted oxidoreductase
VEQRNLGRSGLIVSAVGLGCNNFGGRSDIAATRAVVHKALDLGITFFDNADTYGGASGTGVAEEYLGRALGARRHEIVLATKFGRPMDGSGPRHRLYRPLLPAHRRSLDPDRGDAAGARRPRPAG